jgi:O-antigen ligase
LPPIPTTIAPAGANGVPERAQPRALALAYALFVLIAVGRVGELVPGLGALPLAKVAMALALFLVFAKWKELPRLPVAAKPLARASLLMAALAVLTAPASVWPGASVAFLYQQLPVLLAAGIVSYKVAAGWHQLRAIGRVLVLSAVALAVSALGGFHGGRAISSTASYDPNDLAYLLVTVLPIALAFVLNAKTTARRILNMCVFGVVLIALLLTSSRGGFFGLLAMLLVVVVLPIAPPREGLQQGRTKQRRLSTLLGIVCLAAFVWPTLPLETRTRLSTVLTLESDYNTDTANQQSRFSIWQRNFSAALHRPIGYGVDSFPMLDLRTGGHFKAPHNSYLQALVELGFLGLFLFLRVYALCWRQLQRVRVTLLSSTPTSERDEVVIFARMLQVSLVGNAVAAFFLSTAYSMVLWTLLGAVIGCVYVASATAETTRH